MKLRAEPNIEFIGFCVSSSQYFSFQIGVLIRFEAENAKFFDGAFMPFVNGVDCSLG